jgi:hypothetical protein
MTYEEFVNRINDIRDKANDKARIKFENRSDYYIAKTNGITLTSGPSLQNITVCWGAYNQADWNRGRHKAVIRGD